MNSLPWFLCLGLVCSVVSVPGDAQQSRRIKVAFSCTCDDAVGKLYATAFRDLLATSPRFVETSEAEEKDSKGKIVLNWKVNVVSLDPSASDNGNNTTLSVVLLLGDTYYLTQLVQLASRSTTESAAKYTLSSLDSKIQQVTPGK